MRTIILTSAGFKTEDLQKELLKILPKPPSKLKLAYITTASKVEENRDFVERDRKILTDLGFQIEDVDIEGKNRGTLKHILKDKNIIFVQGGNTFYLLKHIRRSGFEKIVKDLIDKDAIYVGVSAGSYIACPTIEMATWEKKDRQRYGVRNLIALKLVSFLLSVHYDREKYREGLEEGTKGSRFPVRIITDEQALLIRDGEVRLIGSGEEVKLSA